MLTIAIQNGNVIDVRSKKIVKLNIGIQDGVIVQLSEMPLEATRVIDGTGLYVAPGFIDVHGHLDGYEYGGELSAMQGVTTTVGGNCGYCPVQLKEFFDEQDRRGYPINQAMLVGHDAPLREAVGLTDPHMLAEPEQIEQMKELARQALRDGACGVSFGLDYVPGCSIEEVKALASVCAEFGRICPVHTRLLVENDLYSLYEVIDVARQTGAHMLVSHFVYQYCNGMVPQAISMLEKARARGLKVEMDSGMYTNWSTYLNTTTFDLQNIQMNQWSWEQMVVGTGTYRGKVMTEELYHHMRAYHPNEAIVLFEGEEWEIYECLKLPYSMPSSDAGAYAVGEGHPQIAGTFPRYIREMVKERKLLTLEEAIYKGTLLPAEIFDFEKKGSIELGYDADLFLFDLDQIRDMAQYPHLGAPDAAPEGIPYVLVNGVLAVDEGICTHSRSGKCIRK